ncbi:MAG: AAA family ATPase [Melioribacteraceae bacterium]|nr:AAA family ATPase [Melioribacteraceae bacterium]
MALTCEKCNAQNRDIAKYCKKCGTEILNENTIGLDELVGLGQIKDEIRNLVNITKALKNRNGGAQKINMHSIIIGDSGTGKSTIANVLQNLFYQNGLITKKHAEIVDAVDYRDYTEKFQENIQKAKGGILFIDNAQKLVPGGFASDIHQLDKLFSEMDKFGFDPIVILAGLPEGFEDFLEKNPSIKNRFEFHFKLPEYSVNELNEICVRKLASYNLSLNEDSAKRLKSLFKQAFKSKSSAFGNGHFAVNVAEDIFKVYLSRIAKGDPDNNIIKPEDIKGDIPEEKSLDDIMHELDDFIGMENIKTAVREIAKQIQAQKQRTERGIGSDEKLGLHIILTGNPGTGKTTIARKLGEILASIDYLESGHVIEVDRSSLVSQYKGETPKVVKEQCDGAMGGILFVDEAYTLSGTSDIGEKDAYGTEAIETLMKRMEDDRGKFVVIAAGYKNLMDKFLDVNPGMKSRFNKYLHIEDYNPVELFEIYKMFIKKKKYHLSEAAELKVKKLIETIYESRDKNFGNGREMRKIFEETLNKFSQRISTIQISEQTDETLITITAEDIPYEEPKENAVEEVLAELNELTGLKGVKDEITNLTNYLNLEKKRAEQGGTKTPLNIHFVFTGNPGTGKTTVARILGNVFKSLGLLSQGHVVEVDRSKLVANFIGQTGPKTDQIINSALGGILFIDEAYTLMPKGSDGDFGKEAIEVLLKRMEDDRGRFIVVAAGYIQEMDQFLGANPGLKSRFTKYINFEDYKADELQDIFLRLLKKKGMNLSEEANAKLNNYFKSIYNSKDKTFGNAREVRNIFEKTLQRQSARLAELIKNNEQVDSQLNLITYEDIIGEKEETRTIDEILSSLDSFVGMSKVKESIKEIAQQIQIQQERLNRGLAGVEKPGVNIILTGNPGTGKTTVTRKLGEIFKAIGFLPRNTVVEVDRSKLVAQYVGQTPHLVNENCDKAMGGILFVDEAYTLTGNSDIGEKDNYGTEAIETLMKRMEDDRGKFVVIAAGYKSEMEKFLEANPGMKSRFDKSIHIDDYKPEELFEIFKMFAKKSNYTLSNSAEIKAQKAISTIYEKRDKNFANAREMRKLFDETLMKVSDRLMRLPESEKTNEAYSTILPEDIPIEVQKDLSIEDALGGLKDLIGMDSIKDEVRNLAKFLRVEKKRIELGGEKTALNIHFVFTGNPGTGKTTVARIIAEVFKSLGLLSQGQLIEVDRTKLVGSYIGQTAPKTEQVINKAMGGVLFIDEAYTLSPQSQSDYGPEAINTLLKRMEDDRGKFLVIVAGYTNEMAEFLETNPGLASRFTKKIHFDDYQPNEMMQIMKLFVAKKGMILDSEAEQYLINHFTELYNNRDKNFGNARTVRNIFENTIQKQSGRISDILDSPDFSDDQINVIKLEDVIQ